MIRFDVPSDSIVLDRPGPAEQPLDDPAAAVAAALANPLEFPAIERAITPDDRVALALGPGVPQAEAILAGVIYALTEAGIAAERITIVLDEAEARLAHRDVAAGLPEEIRRQVRVVAHQSDTRAELAYLAANEDGKAIYFTREIGEADLVIPINCLRADDVLGHTASNAGLYPTFADEDAQARFNALSSHDEPVHHRRREKESDEAAWLLGVMLTIGVLPGEGDTVLQVLVGESNTVSNEGRRLCEQAWTFDVPERAELVIATVEGGREQQTWGNVGRALHAAARSATADGAIVICCDLDSPPGPSMQRLAADGTSEAAMRAIRRDRYADTLTAAEFWRTLETNRVYLRSRLDAEVTESLGLAHVANDEELQRLTAQHGRCAFIGNAQFAVPRPLD